MKVEIGNFKDDGSERDINVEIHPWDTWSMDSTLAYIITPMLKQLKASTHGAPFVDLVDRPEHLISDKDYEKYETDEFHFDAWDWVLDEMIFAFESKNTDWESQFHDGKLDIWHIPLDKNKKPLGEARPLFSDDEDIPDGVEYWEHIKGPKDTHTWDRKGHEAYQARISNGFRLFGKYYENLWD